MRISILSALALTTSFIAFNLESEGGGGSAVAGETDTVSNQQIVLTTADAEHINRIMADGFAGTKLDVLAYALALTASVGGDLHECLATGDASIGADYIDAGKTPQNAVDESEQDGLAELFAALTGAHFNDDGEMNEDSFAAELDEALNEEDDNENGNDGE